MTIIQSVKIPAAILLLFLSSARADTAAHVENHLFSVRVNASEGSERGNLLSLQ